MKQHTTPCKTCPFRRDCTPGKLGGSPIETFIGQAYGAFWIPCHELLDYKDPNWRYQFDVPQCAGTAIYRSNCHPAVRPRSLLVLPKDTTLVFASPAEFLAHHERFTIREAEMLIELLPPSMLHTSECMKVGAEVIQTGQVTVKDKSDEN